MKKYQVWCNDPIEHDNFMLYETDDKADAELVLESHRDLCDDLYSYWIEEEAVNEEVPAEIALKHGIFYCVSTSTGGYMSLSWDEHFFWTEDAAKVYRDAAKKKGLAVLMVDQDGY